MEFHQVRYFLAAASLLNFTRAAESCNISQPALTRAIQKLEGELGGQLFHRERQLTQLTDLGRLLLPMLEQSHVTIEAVRTRARGFRNGTIAPLRIGLGPSIPASIIAPVLARLAHALEGIEIKLVERTSQQLETDILEGHVHAAMTEDLGGMHARIDSWHLFEERYVAILRDDHPLADLDCIALSALDEVVWLERIGCDATKRLKQLCSRVGVAGKSGHRSRQWNHLQHMAIAGLGIILAPESAPRLAPLVARPIEADPLRRDVLLVAMSGRRYSPALEAFLRIALITDWSAYARSRTIEPSSPKWLSGRKSNGASQHLTV